MTTRHIATLALAAGACVLAAAGAAAQTIGTPTASIAQATLAETGAKTPEVSTEAMRGLIAEGRSIVIDTRSRAEFEAGHIPGAVNAEGPDQVAAVLRLTGGDKTKALVLYCNGPFCQASRRLGEQLADAGFTNVKRYQLGMPVWRALGGPTVVELGGVRRIAVGDKLAVYVDARPADLFAKGSLPHAVSAPVEDVLSGKLKKIDLPEDDFNRRIVLFGRDGADARKLADYMGKRPWHNVMYFPGLFAELSGGLAAK